MSTAALFTNFSQPGACFRGKPFWSWNAKLEADELRRQIRVFKEMGFGGFFMHSRLGLATPYLSCEWFDRIKACVDEAQRLGMEAWLYDEDRYPSGAAGGFATKDKRFRRHILFMTRRQSAAFTWPADNGTTYVFAAVFQGGQLLSYRRLKESAALKQLKANEEILTFNLRTMPDLSWFNNGGYLDTMNPEAVAAFMEITHEAYRREVCEHFGKTIPGIFTDEPNPGPVFREWFDNDGGDVSIAWTPRFPEQFQKMFGYDLCDHLPEIAYDVAGQALSRPRYHYHRCKCRLFVEAFARPMGQWCQQNHLLFTGHTLLEEPGSDTLTMGAAHMQFYPYMQAPGIDVLTAFEFIYNTAKQCTSIAHQTGRQWILSELYGGTGWNASFATYKSIGDWQTALGINLRCPHLSYYSMAGEAKRDYPASIHFQSPWWRQYAYLENYFSRLHTVLTEGAPICDLVVIHPTESYYAVFNKQWQTNPVIKQMDADYNELTHWLLGGHLDFDFADEHLLTELACGVGRDDEGQYLQIGAMKYRAILVPPLVTMRATTLHWLRQFAQAGGAVVCTGAPAKFVDALPDEAAEKFAIDKTVPFTAEAIVAALSPAVRRVFIRQSRDGRECPEVFYQLRRIGADWALFFVNTDRQQSFERLEIQIQLPAESVRQLQLWDAVSGQRRQRPFERVEGGIRFVADLSADGSQLFLAAAQAEALPPDARIDRLDTVVSLTPTAWDYQRDQDNVLLLDYPEFAADTDGQNCYRGGNMEILRLDTELRRRYAIDKRGGHMVQPWVTLDAPLGTSVPLTLTYHFAIESLPPTDTLKLAIEQPQRWRIELNGRRLNTAAAGWWVDPAINALPVPISMLRLGANTLTLTGSFDRLANLERLYLLGNFAVRLQGAKATLDQLPAQLTCGSWTAQGLPFYCGAITYQTEFELGPQADCRYFVQLAPAASSLVEISLNDQAPILAAFNDTKTDITALLRSGRNRLAIKVFSSLQNAFGPLHLPEEYPLCVGPHSYRYQPDHWREDYQLTPYGLGGPVTILAGRTSQ